MQRRNRKLIGAIGNARTQSQTDRHNRECKETQNAKTQSQTDRRNRERKETQNAKTQSQTNRRNRELKDAIKKEHTGSCTNLCSQEWALRARKRMSFTKDERRDVEKVSYLSGLTLLPTTCL